MSRLESFRRRITAQIDGLNWAIAEVAGLDGDVLELGLGNGRTYDHLRENTDRRIWVVDRILQCHPSCVPPEDDFIQDEATGALETLNGNGARIVLAHYDLGFGDKEKDVAESKRMSPMIARLMVPGGLIVTQQPMVGLEEIKGPDSIPEGRYLFYKA